MVARLLFSAMLMTIVSACSIVKTQPISKIALLAPFEGQYREIGYDALYSVRLAFAETNTTEIDLLAIDDGGTVELATQRIEALNRDPSIIAIIALGQFSTSPEAQSALDNKPMLIVGYWGHSVANASSYMLAPSTIESLLDNSDNEADLIFGGELLSLSQIPIVTENFEALRVVSSSTLASETFRENYLASAEFAPEPSLVATLTYDASNIVLEAIQTNTPISEINYEGINGSFRFEDNYWVDAPVHIYQYDNSGILEILD